MCDFKDSQSVFITPKPTRLVRRILEIASDPDSIILDSFAGSGTTGQAVLSLNAKDGGSRRFILVEMDSEICQATTKARLERAVTGKGWKRVEKEVLYEVEINLTKLGHGKDIIQKATDVAAANADRFDSIQRTLKKGVLRVTGTRKMDGDRKGLGGGFRYCRLGAPIFDEHGNIREGVTFGELAAHAYLTETGEPLPKPNGGRSPLLGVHNGRAVYLLFNGVLGDRRPAGGNVLTHDVAQGLPPHPAGAGPRVVYGEACRLGPKSLKRYEITFRQIPFELKVD